MADELVALALVTQFSISEGPIEEPTPKGEIAGGKSPPVGPSTLVSRIRSEHLG